MSQQPQTEESDCHSHLITHTHVKIRMCVCGRVCACTHEYMYTCTSYTLKNTQAHTHSRECARTHALLRHKHTQFLFLSRTNKHGNDHIICLVELEEEKNGKTQDRKDIKNSRQEKKKRDRNRNHYGFQEN